MKLSDISRKSDACYALLEKKLLGKATREEIGKLDRIAKADPEIHYLRKLLARRLVTRRAKRRKR